jgi:hypothetical protein
MRDAARPLLALALVGVLLAAAGATLGALAGVDPRGRVAWTSGTPAFDTTPRDVALFVPACEVTALHLHATASTATQVDAEFFVAMPDGSARRAGSATAPATAGPPLVLPLGDLTLPWRAPLIVRLRTDTGLLTLRSARPLTWEGPASPLGAFACAFDAGAPGQAWATVTSLVITLVATGLLAAAWFARALGLPSDTGSPRWATLAAATMVGATALTYMLVVPPFEPPDELAHLQYARYVATTGTLPHTVPAAGDQWRPSSYEWVQHPLYYLGAAGVLKASGLDAPAPALAENPRSRIRPNGTEPTIFHHAGPPVPPTGHQALRTLRLLSCLMAVATAVAIARLLRTVTDDGLVVATVAGGLALMPQWDAVMGAVSTDPPATLLAALATLAIVRLARGRADTGWLLATGALIGAAYAVKATAVFLAPMAVLACVLDAANRERFDPAAPLPDQAARILGAALRPVLVVGVGIAATAAWVHLRAWLVFGDPQAFAFKKAILEAGGFVPVPGPMPWTAEFWTQMRVMVFEPFWARFGSLGAGPFPGSRVWGVYALASLLLVLVPAWGAVAWMRAAWQELRAGRGGRASCTAMAVTVCGVGVALGLAAWVAVNLAPRADMVVHWTPRHILPLTAPAALLVGAGLERVRTAPALPSRVASALVGATLLALGLAGLGVFRATALMFHFGY